MTPQGYPLFAVGAGDDVYAVVGWEYDRHGVFFPLGVPLKGDMCSATQISDAAVFATEAEARKYAEA